MTPNDVDLVAALDPSDPTAAYTVGERLGDELLQVLVRFSEVRMVPVMQHLTRLYGREETAQVLAAYARLLRAYADQLDGPGGTAARGS